jgi:hypothetical protein
VAFNEGKMKVFKIVISYVGKDVFSVAAEDAETAKLRALEYFANGEPQMDLDLTETKFEHPFLVEAEEVESFVSLLPVN